MFFVLWNRLDPTPVAQQPAPDQPAVAVDALNFEISLLGGAYQRNVLGTASNFMFTGSVATPIPGFENFGVQLDGAVGVYDGDFTSAASALFGQHFESEFIDEVDLSYYYTDNLRVSVGHRLTSRGHVGNLSFEHLLNEQGFDGFSV